MAGCTYGMHLDMNPHHTGSPSRRSTTSRRTSTRSELLSSLMEISPDRYIEYAPKDFFYVMLRDPSPPPLARAASAAERGVAGRSGGAARAGVDAGGLERAGAERTSELPRGGRSSAARPWRLRARDEGARREDGGRAARTSSRGTRRTACSSRSAWARRRRSTRRGSRRTGRWCCRWRGRPGAAARSCGRSADGVARNRAERGGRRQSAAHVDLAEVPLLLDRGAVTLGPAGGRSDARAALGIRPDGRVLIARGTSRATRRWPRRWCGGMHARGRARPRAAGRRCASPRGRRRRRRARRTTRRRCSRSRRR